MLLSSFANLQIDKSPYLFVTVSLTLLTALTVNELSQKERKAQSTISKRCSTLQPPLSSSRKSSPSFPDIILTTLLDPRSSLPADHSAFPAHASKPISITVILALVWGIIKSASQLSVQLLSCET